jgi:hypothetical protein
MSNTVKLLERVRMTTPNKSKEQTAKALGIDRGNLNGMYHKKRYPNPMHCMEISKITAIPLQDVLAYIAADKARSEDTKEAVRMKLPRLLPTAGLAIACLVGAFATEGESRHRSPHLAQATPHEVRIIDRVLNSLRKKLHRSVGLLLKIRPITQAESFAATA